MKTIKELEDNLNEKERMFFENLRKLFMEENDLKFRPEFYYLILENKEILDEIYPLIDFSHDDYSLYNFHLEFELIVNPYKNSYVNDYGIIHIHTVEPSCVFDLIMEEIEDTNKDELCECKPEDENYNVQYRCCGFVCQSIIPRIFFKKTETTEFNDWNYFQRDIWDIKNEWDDIQKENKYHKQKEIEDQIKKYEINIEYFEKLKQELKMKEKLMNNIGDIDY